jgi:hypothetical protein
MELLDQGMFDSSIPLNPKGGFRISKELLETVNNFLNSNLDEESMATQLQQLLAPTNVFTSDNSQSITEELSNKEPPKPIEFLNLTESTPPATPLHGEDFVLTPKSKDTKSEEEEEEEEKDQSSVLSEESPSQKKRGRKSLESYDRPVDLTKDIFPAVQLVCNHVPGQLVPRARFAHIHGAGIPSVTVAEITKCLHLQGKRCRLLFNDFRNFVCFKSWIC